MRRKKVLVHGTADSLKKFFSDAVSYDYEVVAILSEGAGENISVTHEGKSLEVLPSPSLPKFVQSLIDAIIITDIENSESVVSFFLGRGLEFRRIIIWSEKNGWEVFVFKNPDGTQTAYIGGLEFHIRNRDDDYFFKETLNRLKYFRYVRNLNPQLYETLLAQQFQRRTGKPLDFKKLKTYTEKMQWIKLYDATPLKSRLADKYLVRNWVEEKIGGKYLIPLLGVWDDFDDINFDDLPNQFVLKCNHGSGMNIIVHDKKTFDKQQARERINAWMIQDFALMFLELHYTRIDRKIIAEKFMVNGNLPDLTDYKFYCFNGKLSHCKVVSDRSIDWRLDYFDNNWKHLDFERKDHPNSDHPEKIACPKNFELMKELATKLAEGFAHVRVDLYDIAGHVYFGEMTFTPSAGNFSYKSAGTDEQLGGLLKLPKPTPPPPDLNYESLKKIIPCRRFAARDFFCYHGEKFFCGGVQWREVMKTICEQGLPKKKFYARGRAGG